MATVNIVNVTSILPFTINGSATTSATDIIDVPADKLYKVNTILIANIDGTNAADITLGVSTTNGSNFYNIASTISVPADSTLSLLSTTLYLDETDLLRITASANSDLEYTVSGEILDDA
tara:strand:+ start:1572 stop:1931 length:360 start_codon:yes stop_codon:yes gene_type:complete